MCRWPACVLLSVILAVGASVGMHGQTPKPSDQKAPAFEVASVKPNTSGDPRTELGFATPRRFRATNETVRRLIGEAYGTPQALPPFRIVDGPSWIESDRFDIDARTERDTTSEDQHRMLRALLADRFKLVVHTGKRDLPIFALRFARSDGSLGPQLRRSNIDCAALRASGDVPPPSERRRPCVMQFGFGRSAAEGLTISELATVALSRSVGRMVIDQTGLSGPFQWTLVWTPDNLPQRAPGTPPDQPLTVNGLTVDPNGPPLFTALEEQLGLKLESERGPVDVLMIDHVERPTPD